MTGFVVESVHAFVAVGPDGDEGIVACRIGDEWLPLLAADPARLELLWPLAREVTSSLGVTARLVRFDRRTDLEVVEPDDA